MPQNSTYDLRNNIGGGVSLKPGTTSSGSAAFNGDWVDCNALEGPVHGNFQCGSPGGTPDSFSVACKLQEADSSGGAGADDLYSQTALALTAAKTRGVVRGIRTKRYVRCVMTPAFVNGTAPSLPVSADVLGQKKTY